MATDEVDELYVTLRFREELGEAVDDIDDSVDDLEDRFQRAFGQAQDDVEDTTNEVSTLRGRLGALDRKSVEINADLDAADVRAELQALDSKTVDVDVETDRDRSFGGGGGARLPGEMDEVGEAISFVGSLPPKIQALGAAAVGATAALGAGAGLAGVATALAAELGPQGLQSEVRSVKSSFKSAGRTFASEFSGVIRRQIIPAANGLAIAVEGAADGLASFSSFMIQILKRTPGVGLAITAAQTAGAANQDRGNAAALAEGIGDTPGIRKTFTKLQQQIERVRGKFKRDLIPKRDMLKQIKSFRVEAFTSLQKLEQKVPGAFPTQLLDNFAGKIKKVERRLKKLQRMKFLKQAQERASERVGPDVRRVEGATPASDMSGASRMNDVLSVTQLRLKKVKRQLRQTDKQFRQGLGRSGLRFFRSATRIAGNFATGLLEAGEAGKALERSLKQVLSSIISQLIQATIKTIVLKAIIGGLSGGSGAALPTGIVNNPTSGADILGGALSKSGGVGAVTQTGPATLAQGNITIPVGVTASAAERGRQQQTREGTR